jgi:hypothetical protein
MNQYNTLVLSISSEVLERIYNTKTQKGWGVWVEDLGLRNIL